MHSVTTDSSTFDLRFCKFAQCFDCPASKSTEILQSRHQDAEPGRVVTHLQRCGARTAVRGPRSTTQAAAVDAQSRETTSSGGSSKRLKGPVGRGHFHRKQKPATRGRPVPPGGSMLPRRRILRPTQAAALHHQTWLNNTRPDRGTIPKDRKVSHIRCRPRVCASSPELRRCPETRR